MFGALKRGFRSMASLILVRNVIGELQPKRTLAASRGFLAAARLSCNMCIEQHVPFWSLDAKGSYLPRSYIRHWILHPPDHGPARLDPWSIPQPLRRLQLPTRVVVSLLSLFPSLSVSIGSLEIGQALTIDMTLNEAPNKGKVIHFGNLFIRSNTIS